MGSAKWIVGLLGWVTWGPIGALLGFLAGTAVDRYIEAARQLPGFDDGPGNPWQRQAGGATRQQTGSGSRGYTAQEQRNSFFVSLLVLSSAVIRADGKTLQSELDCVRNFFRVDNERCHPTAVENLKAAVLRFADHMPADGPQRSAIHGFFVVVRAEKAIGKAVNGFVSAGNDFCAGSREKPAQIVLLGLNDQAAGSLNLLDECSVLENGVQFYLRHGSCSSQYKNQRCAQILCKMFHCPSPFQ